MASPPNPIFVDWTRVNIWCCGEYFHIDDIAGHAEQRHSNSKKVKIEDIGDIAEHSEQVHSNREEVVIDESSEMKRKQSHMIDVNENNDNYNFVVSRKKIENSMRINDKINDNRKYYCDLCDYKTTQKYHLTIHIENKHLGIRHECEVCQFRCTTKAGLNRHRKRIHVKSEIKREIDITDTFQNIATETPSLFLSDTEIKQEVVDPILQANVPATLILSHNGNAEIEQEIVSETPTLLENQMVSVAVDVLTEVKEEVDEENLQVPGWRIIPQFEHPPLNDRRKELGEGKTGEVDNVFLEEQAAIKKLHAKLEKKEKDIKKWDAQWRKRQEDIQKLNAVKDRSSGKDVKMEAEEIEVLWPNSDYVTDLVVVDVGQEKSPAEQSS